MRTFTQRSNERRCCCGQIQLVPVRPDDFSNGGDERRTDAHALIVRQYHKAMHPLCTLFHGEKDDARMTHDLAVDNANILLCGGVQVGVQIVILPKDFPSLLLNCVVNPVYFKLDWRAVELSRTRKKRCASVS